MHPGQNDQCWPWNGSIHGGRDQRGFIKVNRKNLFAHRVAWALTHGGELPTLQVLHSCDNSLCCNPRHLFLGTQQDNIRDMDQKGRRKSVAGPQWQKRKLSREQEGEIRQRYAAHGVRYVKWGPLAQAPGRVKMQDLADEFGVSLAVISRCVNRVVRHKEHQS